jgi:hypothetical protein
LFTTEDIRSRVRRPARETSSTSFRRARGANDQGQTDHVAIVTAVTPDGDIKYTQHSDQHKNVSWNDHEAVVGRDEGDQQIVIVRVKSNW